MPVKVGGIEILPAARGALVSSAVEVHVVDGRRVRVHDDGQPYVQVVGARELVPGCRVIVFANGRWHPGVVLSLGRTRARVEVHFLRRRKVMARAWRDCWRYAGAPQAG